MLRSCVFRDFRSPIQLRRIRGMGRWLRLFEHSRLMRFVKEEISCWRNRRRFPPRRLCFVVDGHYSMGRGDLHSLGRAFVRTARQMTRIRQSDVHCVMGMMLRRQVQDCLVRRRCSVRTLCGCGPWIDRGLKGTVWSLDRMVLGGLELYMLSIIVARSVAVS